MSLGTKLKFSPDRPVTLLNPPDSATELFGDFTIKATIGTKKVNQVVLFVADKAMLDAQYPKVISKLEDDAIFWIGYPKQSGGIPSDLIRNTGWDAVLQSEYRIVSSAAINDEWTAVRIARKKPDAAYKSSIPMEERNTPGIDYKKRTTQLPKDAIEVMKDHSGLETFFYKMSFSHQREYIEAIEEAKKPETRQRRIAKMIEMVLDIKNKKELKLK
ncbi:MAG: YdeI/OmpD-associated family protein [Bacteroidetes bacterium]|nr:YdeI/OmpD-associated family protein [Bacteroidota bacterium]